MGKQGIAGATKQAKVKTKKAAAKKNQKASKILSLRNKIFMSFLIPIIFMIIVGTVSVEYSKAGLSDRFKESSEQTINMAGEYLDLSLSYIQSKGMEYAFDSGVEEYSMHMMGKDGIAISNYYSDERRVLLAGKASNPVINNIHIITDDQMQMISTADSAKKPGILAEYMDEMSAIASDGKGIKKWVDAHPVLDSVYNLKTNEYFLSCQQQTLKKFGVVVIDVSESSLRSILDEVDFGKGSYVGIVSGSGKEIVKDAEYGTAVFTGQSFYEESLASEDLSGCKSVKYNGADYIYIYRKSEMAEVSICALIPEKTVVSQADKIKNITIIFVIAATAIALFIGMIVTVGIQRNMKSISKSLDEVAKGNLTVAMNATGHDEFQSLASTATNMVENNKKLVMKLNGTTRQLEGSAFDVTEASSSINSYSADITQAISGISEGMNRQAVHAQECVEKTNVLSEKIKDISNRVSDVEGIIDATEDMISQGTQIVDSLSVKAAETTQITRRVGDTIDRLRMESESINEFVATITAISAQTNLLSLNASIEAARAGEAGRGFAVVAEEIRKLADDSAKAAEEIRNKVNEIGNQTRLSVQSAKDAENMVSVQGEAVEAVTEVFNNISNQMNVLFDEIKGIAESTEVADQERGYTLNAVENISEIIDETTSNSDQVHNMAQELLSNVERLSKTAQMLDENMVGLKDEIAAFKIE